jgi:coenzyme F420-reducing hydrogenase beta subunit
MQPDSLGFLYPLVDKEKCVECGLCKERCPVNSEKTNRKAAYDTKAYAAIANDADVRKHSSSGGVFYLIAKYVIMNGGVVFGAAFDETYHFVKHICVDTLREIKKLQGSKYVQSEIGTSYIEAKAYLEQGRLVLFTGTLCQISGFRAFLNKDYENLFLQDIVCHGVPSPSVWDAYLTNLENRHNAKAVSVSFRDKTKGWQNYLLRIEFDNGYVYYNDRVNDLYMRGFLHDYYLRRSCHECVEKGKERLSDITLADLWGAEKLVPTMQDGKGTSLVIASSAKGNFLLEQISQEIHIKEMDLNGAVVYNPAITRSANKNSARDGFETDFSKKPIMKVMKKYCAMTPFKKIRKKISSLLKK